MQRVSVIVLHPLLDAARMRQSCTMNRKLLLLLLFVAIAAFYWILEVNITGERPILYSCIKGTHRSRECCVPWENERNSTRCPGSSVVVADGVGFWPWNRPRSGILLGSAWRSWGKNGKMKWYVVNQHSNTLLSWRLCCRNDDYRWTWLLRWRKGVWSSNWKYVAYPESLQWCS